MPIKTQCPRCKQPLSVPNKLAGSYANCPRCQGRFWIAKDAPADGAAGDAVRMPAATLTLTQATATPSSAPVAIPSSMVVPPPVPPRSYLPSVAPLAPSPTPQESPAEGSPAPPPKARNVARLVTADAADSSLKVAADGQLPNLQLQDTDKKEKGRGKSRSISPLVLIGAWVFSVVMTIAIVMVSGNNNESDAMTAEKARAMKEIEEQYFGDPSRGVLLRHQRLLRAAQQARAREDYEAEKQYYRQVLDLLRTESRGGGQSSKRLEKGITGSRVHDQELERLIITVLGD